MIAREEDVDFFRSNTQEHVLPQNPPPASEWLSWFPDDDERDNWTHRLANLVPLDIRKNPVASNYDFATKKNIYFKGKGIASPFVLTQEARSEDEWMPAILATRQLRLIGVLKEHWNLAVTDEVATSLAAS